MLCCVGCEHKMARAKRDRRGGDPALHSTRGIPKRLEEKNPEEDPLKDLRPEEYEDPVDSAADEYIWPDLNDENEEDD